MLMADVVKIALKNFKYMKDQPYYILIEDYTKDRISPPFKTKEELDKWCKSSRIDFNYYSIIEIWIINGT